MSDYTNRPVFGPRWFETKAASEGRRARARQEPVATCPYPANKSEAKFRRRQHWIEGWITADNEFAGAGNTPPDDNPRNQFRSGTHRWRG